MKCILFGVRGGVFVVLFLIFVIVLFFLIYQSAIGNPFLEEIHPVFVLLGFLIFLGISTYLVPTFRVTIINGKIVIRDGFRIKVLRIEDVREVFEGYVENLRDVNCEVFDFGGNFSVGVKLKSGEVILIYTKNGSLFKEFLKVSRN